MRHVFSSHAEVAHVWANSWREVGHGSGKNVYFRGPTIYSYGSHFPIASWVTARDGSDVVLFTTRSYSVSTAKHISIVRRAIPPGVRIYYVSDPSSRSWRTMMRQALDNAAALKSQAERRWRHDRDLSQMQEQIAAARFCAYEARIKLPADDEEVLAVAERLVRNEARRLRIDREKREAAEKERLSAAEAIWDRTKPYWRAHQQFPEEIVEAARAIDGSNPYGLSIALRLTGDDIETSWGARFPVNHATRAFAFLKAVWQRGSTWERNGGSGPRLGYYSIDRITPEGVQAGCHWVSRDEIELMARTLNVADVPPAPVYAAA